MPELKVTIPYHHHIKDTKSKKGEAWRLVTIFNVLSKNRTHEMAIGRTKTGKRKYFPTPNKNYEKITDDIKNMVLSKLNGHKFQVGKIMLDIMVYRKNMMGDPLNLIDGIADAVKKAIDVDDRHYGCCVDWELDKENPRVELTIKQEDVNG